MPQLFKPTRSPNWFFWYRDPVSGKQRQLSCGTPNKREAERVAVIKLHEILTVNDENTAPASTPPASATIVVEAEMSTVSLSEFQHQYLAVKAETLSPRTVETINDTFNQFCKRIGADRPLQGLTLLELERFILTGQPSLSTSRKHYGHLRAAFDKAVQWELIPENHFRQITKPRAPQMETEYFSVADFVRLYNAMPTQTIPQRRLRNTARLAFETGMRLSELRYLTIDAIDLDRKLLTVRNTREFTTKSKKPRTIPLSQAAIETILLQLDDIRSDPRCSVRETKYLFPNHRGKVLSLPSVSDKFALVCKPLFPDRPGLCFHSLRHGFGTRLARAGVSPQMIQKLMGHCSVTVTERYTHLQGMDFSPAMAVLNAVDQ